MMPMNKAIPGSLNLSKAAPVQLGGIFVAALASLMLLNSACIATNSRVGYGISSGQAMRQVCECATAKVAALDDGKSDAATVALALSNLCASSYDAWVRAVADEQLANDRQKQRYMWHRHSQESRSEFFVPFVLSHRANPRPTDRQGGAEDGQGPGADERGQPSTADVEVEAVRRALQGPTEQR